MRAVKQEIIRDQSVVCAVRAKTAVAFGIAFGILRSMIFAISTSLGLLVTPMRLLISLAMFVYGLCLMYQAYSQKKYRIPVIGDLAAKPAGASSRGEIEALSTAGGFACNGSCDQARGTPGHYASIRAASLV